MWTPWPFFSSTPSGVLLHSPSRKQEWWKTYFHFKTESIWEAKTYEIMQCVSSIAWSHFSQSWVSISFGQTPPRDEPLEHTSPPGAATFGCHAQSASQQQSRHPLFHHHWAHSGGGGVPTWGRADPNGPSGRWLWPLYRRTLQKHPHSSFCVSGRGVLTQLMQCVSWVIDHFCW